MIETLEQAQKIALSILAMIIFSVIVLLLFGKVLELSNERAQAANDKHRTTCTAEFPAGKRVFIKDGGFRQQTGNVISTYYEHGCFAVVVLDNSKATIAVKINNLIEVKS